MLSYLLRMHQISSMLQPLFSTLFVAIFLILLYKWYSTRTATVKHSSPPPSPPKLPVIGNLHQLGLHPHRSLQALSQQHGPLMLLHFGSVPVLVVSSPKAAREILKTHDHIFSDRPKSTNFEKLLYNYKDIASAPYGEYWRQVKSICVSNLLSNKMVRSFRAVREEETKSMISNIQQSPTSVLNLSEITMGLTSDVVCRVALGRKYSGGEGGRKFRQILGVFIDLLGTIIIGDYIPWLAWLRHVNGLEAKLNKVATQFDEFIDGVVQEHMEKTGTKSRNDDEQKDLVDILLQIQKGDLGGFPIDILSIKALIWDMFAAGSDTTYSVLEWAMSELLRYPRLMSKLQNEVRGIVGNRTDTITEDDLVKMNYLKAVLKETLRLHPPNPLLFPRISTQDVEVCGYNIKANTQVMINAWQIGRDPELYDKAEEFKPERFLDSGMDYKGNDFKFIPFGGGRRGCPGMQFAMSINEIALANLVHKFDWTLADGAKAEDLDMTESTGITIHRKYPLKAVAIPYSC